MCVSETKTINKIQKTTETTNADEKCANKDNIIPYLYRKYTHCTHTRDLSITSKYTLAEELHKESGQLQQ